jgi:cysteine desulfuration protein SufE
VKTASIDELVEEFEFLDPEDRTGFIIELGAELDDMPDNLKTEENRVLGCISNVWLVAHVQPADPPVLTFQADSDSQIARGLIAIVTMICSGRPAAEIIAMDLESAFDRLQLRRYITRSRSNGFYSMIKRLRRLAEMNAD